MSYQGRRDHFTCDSCGRQEHVAGGLPKGWVWAKVGIGKTITHACEKCKAAIPKEQRREAGEKN